MTYLKKKENKQLLLNVSIAKLGMKIIIQVNEKQFYYDMCERSSLNSDVNP